MSKRRLIHAGITVVCLTLTAAILYLGHVSTASLLASLVSTLPLSLTFALQSQVQGFLAGRTVRAEKHIHVGDYVTCGIFAGTVEHIGFRVTVLSGLDGRPNLCPNVNLMAGFIVGKPEEKTT